MNLVLTNGTKHRADASQNLAGVQRLSGMRNLLMPILFLSAALSLPAVVFTQVAPSQRSEGVIRKSSPAPRGDLSGIWVPAGVNPIGFSDKHPPFTPLGEKQFRANRPGRGITEVPVADTNDPLDSCDPEGFPRNEIFEFRAVQIVQTPDRMLLLYQYQRVWRAIFTDGRLLPKDPDPNWYGYSVRKWVDDQTFVAQTVGLDDRTWIDNSGLPHSADLRVEERFHRLDHDTIEFTLILDDPKTYTATWTIIDKLKLTLDSKLEIPEMLCVPTEMEQYKRLVANPAGDKP